MPRTPYQYGTSPRKYEPEYTTKRTTKRKTETKSKPKKAITKKKSIKTQNQTAQKNNSRVKQVIVVMAVFGMLLTISYREIAIMEMFNQKKDMETQLAEIEKENGQVEKSIKEVESTLDWNKIKQIATEQLGMQQKTTTPVDLEKTDSVETETKLIQEEKTSLLEKIVGFFINK